MKIPDIGSSERPSPGGVSTGLAQYRSDFGGQEQAGQMLMQTGHRIETAANEVFHAAKVEQDKIDNLKAEDAWSKLRERQLDLTLGEKDGFNNLKGAAAVNTPILKDWSSKFQNEATALENGLTTEEQKAKFRQRSAISFNQFRESILRHTATESAVYAKEVFDGTVAVEIRQATASWQNPADVATSLERINAAVSAQADRNGWAPEFAAATKLQADGKVHAAVIGQALANKDYEYAQKWYQTYKADIDLPTAKALESAVLDGTQRQVTAAYNTAIIDNRDQPGALRQIEKQIGADPRLDDTRRAALLGSVTGKVDQIERRLDAQADRDLRRQEINARRAEAAQQRWERRIERNIDQIVAKLPFGEPSMEQLTPLIDATKGTPMQGEVAQLVATSNATRAFRLAPAVQQENYLNQVRALARTDPGKVDAKMIPILEGIFTQQQRQIKDSPVSFVIGQGLVDMKSPAAQPLDTSKPESIAAQLPARIGLAREAAARTAGPFKPLTSEEADLAVATLRTLNVEGRKAYFGNLVKAAGSDFAGYTAIMGQIAPDRPILAHAGIAAARNLDDGKGRRLSDLLLIGDAALNPNRKADGSPDTGKLLPLPPETKMRMDFDNYVRDALAGNVAARSDYYQSAKAVYMALSIQAGDKDTSVLNSTRWDESMRLAMGGIEAYNGKRTIMPWGQDYGQFKDGLNARINSVFESGRLAPGMTPQKMRDMQLEPAGDGKYVMKSGDQVLVDKTGRAVLLDFTRPPIWTPPKVERAPTQAELDEAGKPYTGRSVRRRVEDNIDTSRPRIENPDGSFSTERTITIEADGKHFLIPTIVNGRQMTEQEAIKAWRSGANKEVGVFDTAAAADKAAVARSKRIGDIRGNR